jgi:hypothetical protein
MSSNYFKKFIDEREKGMSYRLYIEKRKHCSEFQKIFLDLYFGEEVSDEKSNNQNTMFI